jgi:hypothetical protein
MNPVELDLKVLYTVCLCRICFIVIVPLFYVIILLCKVFSKLTVSL